MKIKSKVYVKSGLLISYHFKELLLLDFKAKTQQMRNVRENCIKNDGIMNEDVFLTTSASKMADNRIFTR